jgi:hypothetical protein
MIFYLKSKRLVHQTQITVSILTVSWQSWKAAISNPVEALRFE